MVSASVSFPHINTFYIYASTSVFHPAFPHSISKILLEDVTLCNEWHIESVLLSMRAQRQICLLRNAVQISLPIIT